MRCVVPRAVRSAACVHGAKCNAHDLWTALGSHIESFLRKVSLQMVLEGDFDMADAGLPAMTFSGVRIVEN